MEINKEELIKKIKKSMNFNLAVGLVLFALITVLALIGLIGTPYDTTAMNSSLKNSAPTFQHIMGCDNFGRDIFSRVCQGIGNTFVISIVTVLIGTVVGIIMGALTGYFGGIVDDIFMRINDALFAFPSILLALVIISLLGMGRYNVMIALGIAFIPSFTRMMRAEFLKQKNLDYVLAAKLMGASDFRIMFVHILPNTMSVFVPSIIIGFNNAVLAEAGLSYLGIGVQPPDASLGRMLSEAQSFMFTNPYYAMFPGLIIIILVLGLALISEGLQKGKTNYFIFK